MVPLDRALLVSSYRLSIVTMPLSAAVWPQFVTLLFRGGAGNLLISRVMSVSTTFTSAAQATKCCEISRIPAGFA